MSELTSRHAVVERQRKPRLGFLGVGWIGRHRMQAIHESGVATVAAVADLSPALVEEAVALAPGAIPVGGLNELLDAELDGLVIATPSALHADQAIAALRKGLAVFCQKPLARSAEESERVIEAAREADRLLAVDLSYRYISGMEEVRELVRGGDLGEIYAVNLLFHNAYGPDKGWFYDPRLSGGGCVIDLGIHLVDLALWVLDYPEVTGVTSRLYAEGVPLDSRATRVEDFAAAQLELASQGVVQLACSWKLPAGRDALIEAAFYGTGGGAALRNVGGSFYDFTVERFRGTSAERVGARDVSAEVEAGAWGGRAAVEWATRLARGDRYDPSVERLGTVAAVLDTIYGR